MGTSEFQDGFQARNGIIDLCIQDCIGRDLAICKSCLPEIGVAPAVIDVKTEILEQFRVPERGLYLVFRGVEICAEIRESFLVEIQVCKCVINPYIKVSEDLGIHPNRAFVYG